MYTFEWKGHKITLVLSPLETCKPTVSVPNTLMLLIVPSSNFATHAKESGHIFLLIPKDQAHECSVLLPVISHLLVDFTDSLPQELPEGLTPTRDVQHQIELIPRAKLPNLPHYQMATKEHEILQGQVDE